MGILPAINMASITLNGIHYCSSCIVSSNVLLSSAACTQILRTREQSFFEVEAVLVNIDGSLSEKRYQIIESKEHPTFKKRYYKLLRDIDVGIFVVGILISFAFTTYLVNSR